MDYFQGVVTEYLRAKRSVFINTECLISLNEGEKLKKGRHWYCDVMAVDFKQSSVFLCEITYSTTAHSLLSRLQGWRSCWPELANAVRRDSGVPAEWIVRPWVFLPSKYAKTFQDRYAALPKPANIAVEMPDPRLTHLESTLPWEYLVTRTTDDIVNGT